MSLDGVNNNQPGYVSLGLGEGTGKSKKAAGNLESKESLFSLAKKEQGLTADSGSISATAEGRKRLNQGDEKFKNSFEQSKLDDRIPTKASLNKLGFEQSKLMDTNGGQYYTNKNGDQIRISNFDHTDSIGDVEGGTFVDYKSKDGKIHNSISYDKFGNPVKGMLKVTNTDGTVTSYQFKYDDEGNLRVVFQATTLKEPVQWE